MVGDHGCACVANCDPRLHGREFVGGALFSAVPVLGADVSSKAPQYNVLAPAVDGLNGKLEALGGSFADRSIYGGKGSFSIPLGTQFGLQIDGAAGSFDSRAFGSAGGHLFWRNPAQGLVGIYANYTYWDRYGGAWVGQVAGEGEVYFGRFSIQGIAGVEFGNRAANATTSTTVTGIPNGSATTTTTLAEFYDVKTRFFDQVNFSYYIQDNLKVFVGHRYLGGKNAAAFGAEAALPLHGGTMASLFVEGRAGEDNFHGVWGGVKFYFGQKDKSLMQRQRQDDPINWSPEFLFSIVNSFGRTGTGTTVFACQGTEIYNVVTGQCQ